MKKRTTPPRRNSGFTLIEMLIVVAIIAILVAVSIPIVGSSLERARIATDAANERAAKAEAVIMYLSDDFDATLAPDKYWYYDAANGKIVDPSSVDDTASLNYGKCNDHKEGYIAVRISQAGDVTLTWNEKGVGGFTSNNSKNHNGNVTTN